MGIWKEDKQDFAYKLYKDTDTFFENINEQSSLNAEYRPGQHSLALDTVDAINNKEISLVEAGVGSGKSWGYLVPLLLASKNDPNFKGFIISTSSIALQEQLKREIKVLSDVLGVDIDVTIAKGRNNYICPKRLGNYVKANPDDTDIKEIVSKSDNGIIDKENYPNIARHVWNRININQTNCSKCLDKKNCQYILNRKNLPKAKYVVCNHDLLVEALKRDTVDTILKNPDILVVDEAHALEEKIRNSYKKTITKKELEMLINYVTVAVSDYSEETYAEDFTITALNRVFNDISHRARYQYRKSSKTDTEIFNDETSGFTMTEHLAEDLRVLTARLDNLLARCYQHKSYNSKLARFYRSLEEYNNVFKDLLKPEHNRDNVYIASFMPNTHNHISLDYVPKNIALLAKNLLGDNSYGKVFTSATMTTGDDDYTYFATNLGLDRINGVKIVKEYPQKSPFDYDNNALLYLDKTTVSPKSLDHSLYLKSIALKIDDLIKTTKGRSLVLFTAKQDMLDVYNMLDSKDHDFNLLVQNDRVSADRLKNIFKDDVSSVLFATGSFWEGVDIKGESLMNVIIPKLPFPVVDPIIEEKASYYKDGFKEVYMKEMLLKLKQGAGRLIRGNKDKGIVAILDSRVTDYESDIRCSLPFNNVTDKMEDVHDFVNNGFVKVKK